MNGSCGNKRRGCEIDNFLPHDSQLITVCSEMLRGGNGIQTVLPAIGYDSHEVMAQERQVEAVYIEAVRSLHLLQ